MAQSQVSFNSLQELLSQLVSFRSLSSFLLLLPFDSTPWGEGRIANQHLPHSHRQGGSGPAEKVKYPCHTMCWGPRNSLHPSQLHYSMVPSYSAVTRHICQPLVLIGAPGKKQAPASCSRITLQTSHDTLRDPLGVTEIRGRVPSRPLQRGEGEETRCLR